MTCTPYYLYNKHNPTWAAHNTMARDVEIADVSPRKSKSVAYISGHSWWKQYL